MLCLINLHIRILNRNCTANNLRWRCTNFWYEIMNYWSCCLKACTGNSPCIPSRTWSRLCKLPLISASSRNTTCQVSVPCEEDPNHIPYRAYTAQWKRITIGSSIPHSDRPIGIMCSVVVADLVSGVDGICTGADGPIVGTIEHGGRNYPLPLNAKNHFFMCVG